MDLGRMFEYTDEAVANRFRPERDILLNDLIRLPCLFMEEGTADAIARVGYINEARIVGREVVIDYGFDQTIPSLLNSTIHANKRDFGMPVDFEFSRGHWAVKDVDLFRTLLRVARPQRQRPRVFTLPEHESIDNRLVSVMMPFDAGFTTVYDSLREMAGRLHLRCRRADDIWEDASVIQDVVSLIDRSRFVICDCTNRNPNVFYEIGIAHTLGREVILITQNASDVPFDLTHLRFVRYLNNAEGRAALCETLARRIADIVEA